MNWWSILIICDNILGFSRSTSPQCDILLIHDYLKAEFKKAKPFSRQFHQRYTCAIFVQNFGAKPNVTREKLLNSLSYKKRARKTLMKLTPGNIINRLLRLTPFKSVTCNFNGP